MNQEQIQQEAEKLYPLEDVRKNMLHDNPSQRGKQMAFIEGAIYAQLKWISVEDRLPEKRILPVLVFNGKAPIYMQCTVQALWLREYNNFKNKTSIIIRTEDITHWMPLPNKS